jgi:hypothetical protein
MFFGLWLDFTGVILKTDKPSDQQITDAENYFAEIFLITHNKNTNNTDLLIGKMNCFLKSTIMDKKIEDHDKSRLQISKRKIYIPPKTSYSIIASIKHRYQKLKDNPIQFFLHIRPYTINFTEGKNKI